MPLCEVLLPPYRTAARIIRRSRISRYKVMIQEDLRGGQVVLGYRELHVRGRGRGRGAREAVRSQEIRGRGWGAREGRAGARENGEKRNTMHGWATGRWV